MDWKTAAVVFGTVFVAELGDKTQLATLLFAANRPQGKLLVFLAASAALVVASAIGVLAGSVLTRHVEPRYLTLAAGVGFLIIGLWTIWSALR
jgi:putative Ca2+/H+ antiporter (TMEM165/GDT1 family)